MRLLTTALASSALALCCPWVLADTGKLLLTGGVNSAKSVAGPASTTAKP